MKMYIRKTKDIYVLYGNYGYGWAELCTYDSYSEAKADLKIYRENELGALHKIEKHREKIN